MPARVSGSPRSCTCLAFLFLWAGTITNAAQAQTTDCRDAQQCRELALDARARGAYESFHDLAWRAVHAGRPGDPDLMYLLARAQALSGRRRDAVVMLRRLAESGYAIEAADEDFRRVRELGEWQYVAALLNRPPAASASAPGLPRAAVAVPAALPSKPNRSAGRAAIPRLTRPAIPPAALAAAATAAAVPAAKPPAVTPAATPAKPAAAPPAPAVVRRTLPLKPAVVEDAARFSTGPFTPSGIAYDAISRRFLFGDVTGRRLFVVGEGSERSVDLVRADSAGFDDVTALAIDPKRGDLWVASTAADGSAGAIHRLQLISGRALAKVAVPGQASTRLSDLAVAGDGTLFILDSSAPRLLALRPGAPSVEPVMQLTISNPTSMAVDDLGLRAYVAHSQGIARIDLQARRASPLTAGDGVALSGFHYIRAYRDSLIGSQVQADGSRGVVRLQLNGERRAVSAATLIDTSSVEDDARMATISGDDLYYLTGVGQASTAGPVGVRVRRLKLR